MHGNDYILDWMTLDEFNQLWESLQSRTVSEVRWKGYLFQQSERGIMGPVMRGWHTDTWTKVVARDGGYVWYDREEPLTTLSTIGGMKHGT